MIVKIPGGMIVKSDTHVISGARSCPDSRSYCPDPDPLLFGLPHDKHANISELSEIIGMLIRINNLSMCRRLWLAVLRR
jgi:hypothetical protein